MCLQPGVCGGWTGDDSSSGHDGSDGQQGGRGDSVIFVRQYPLLCLRSHGGKEGKRCRPKRRLLEHFVQDGLPRRP